MIYEGAEGPSSGGRKPTYLYINGENAYVLAIDIGVRDTVYAISDFNGRILKQKSKLLPKASRGIFCSGSRRK